MSEFELCSCNNICSAADPSPGVNNGHLEVQKIDVGVFLPVETFYSYTQKALSDIKHTLWRHI